MIQSDNKYIPEETALETGITGVKIQDMAAKRINNHTFNWDCLKSFKGDTGSYLQYARLARLHWVQKPAPPAAPAPSAINTSLLLAFPHEPGGMVMFAFRPAHAISSAWDVLVVKSEEDVEKAQAKMWVYESAQGVLAVAMQLLGLRPLERM